ncbi:MAG: hypothetical protein U0872_14060 [Planctomycetaceae bacterium]
MLIQTSCRQRRSNGEWGKLKPLKVRPGKLEDIDDDEDRRILAYLLGGTPDRSQIPTVVGESLAAVSRYRVPHDLCELLLPAICATGRMRVVGDEERSREPIAWDAGPPWELCLAVEPQPDGEGWALAGRLQRGEERLSIREPALLLPGGLVLWRRSLARLLDFEAFAWVGLLRRTDDLVVPADDKHDLIDRLLDMPALPRLELPEELRLEEVRVAPQPLLMIHSPARTRWQTDRLRAEVLFVYDDVSCAAAAACGPSSAATWPLPRPDARRKIRMDSIAGMRLPPTARSTTRPVSTSNCRRRNPRCCRPQAGRRRLAGSARMINRSASRST